MARMAKTRNMIKKPPKMPLLRVIVKKAVLAKAETIATVMAKEKMTAAMTATMMTATTTTTMNTKMMKHYGQQLRIFQSQQLC